MRSAEARERPSGVWVYVWVVRRTCALALAVGLVAGRPEAAAAQSSDWDSITQAGVVRAAAVVDSVFVDRQALRGFVGAGDWAAYLMARLGVNPVPRDLKIRVVGDTSRVRLSSRLGDLPYEARRALGPLLGILPPDAEIAGDITLVPAARNVVRFHLATVRLNGVPIPELLLQTAMFDVGRQYPALTRTGRDLLVEIPPDAVVALALGGVRLAAPPADSTRRQP